MNAHLITPPEELVEQWEAETAHTTKDEVWHVAVQAAQWGADQELEACCEWLRKDSDAYELVGLLAVYLDLNLRAARRPEPPSLKEQALALLEVEHGLNVEDLDLLRRALEALPND